VIAGEGIFGNLLATVIATIATGGSIDAAFAIVWVSGTAVEIIILGLAMAPSSPNRNPGFTPSPGSSGAQPDPDPLNGGPDNNGIVQDTNGYHQGSRGLPGTSY
jgi:hypothetical protein